MANFILVFSTAVGATIGLSIVNLLDFYFPLNSPGWLLLRQVLVGAGLGIITGQLIVQWRKRHLKSYLKVCRQHSLVWNTRLLPECPACYSIKRINLRKQLRVVEGEKGRKEPLL